MLNFIADISADFSPQRHFFSNIFQIYHIATGVFHIFYHIFHFGFNHKRTRGQNGFNQRGFAHGNHIFRTDRKVNHHRSAVICRKSEKCANCGNSVRQQNTDIFINLGKLFKAATQSKRSNNNVFIRLLLAVDIFYNTRAFRKETCAGIDFSGFHQLGKKRDVVIIRGVKAHIAHNHINFIADVISLTAQCIF